MKTTALVFLFGSLTCFSWSQKELVNVYSSFSEVHGGMEDSGVSRTESFTFVAKATIEIKDIFYNDQKIILQKGDTLVVNVGKYIPYNLEAVDTTKRTIVGRGDLFKVMKVGRKFYANLQFHYAWEGIIEYIYKKKIYASKIKEGFDDGFTEYAP